jgi:hypothetical protein
MMNQKKINSFNFDIDDYDIKDLENLFGVGGLSGVGGGVGLGRNQIDRSEYAIIEKIKGDVKMDHKTRTQLLQFYSQAKGKLVALLDNKTVPPTTFQYGGREQLDAANNIWTPNVPGAYSGGMEYGRPGSTLDIYDPKTGRRDQNEVLHHNDKDFVNANVSHVFAGVINPLNTRFINKYLTIDSRFRETPYTNSSLLINSTSDFTIQLPDKIPRVIGMQLASLEIPITYYATSSYIGNNYVSVVVTDTIGGVSRGVVVVPDGTYTAVTIGSAITAGLVALGGYFATITLSYSTINGHFTIATTSVSVASFTLDFTTSPSGNAVSFVECVDKDLNICSPSAAQTQQMSYSVKTPMNVDLTRRLGYSLGFLNPVYSGAKSYVGEGVSNTSGSRYIFLAVDDFNNNVVSNQFITIAPQNISSKNILARITVGNGGFLSILSENDFKIITEPRKYFGPVDITRLRVQLYDDYGLLLKMNGGDFSFNLLLEVVYDL